MKKKSSVFTSAYNEGLHFQKNLFNKINNAFGGDETKDEVLKFKDGGDIASGGFFDNTLKKGGECKKKMMEGK